MEELSGLSNSVAGSIEREPLSGVCLPFVDLDKNGAFVRGEVGLGDGDEGEFRPNLLRLDILEVVGELGSIEAA